MAFLDGNVKRLMTHTDRPQVTTTSVLAHSSLREITFRLAQCAQSANVLCMGGGLVELFSARTLLQDRGGGP